jgi:hypothetical protein
MVGMHYAVQSLFADNAEELETLNYKAKSEYFEKLEAGEMKLAVGKYNIRSRITHSVKQFSFAVLHLGQHHIIGASSDKLNSFTLLKMYAQMKSEFENSNVNGVITLMHQYFGAEKFSIKNLFKDEQRKVLQQIIEHDLRETETLNLSIFERNVSTINALDLVGMELPHSLRKNMELVLNAEIRNYFQHATLKPSRLKKYVEQASKWNIKVDDIYIPRAVETRIKQELRMFSVSLNYETLYRVERAIKHIQALQLKIDFIESQTLVFKIAKAHLKHWKTEAEKGEQQMQFLRTFEKLMHRLNIVIKD